MMESIPANPILKFNPNTHDDIKKCWNLENGRMEQSIILLEEWLLKQNHFVNKKFSRAYLELSLVFCKGSVEKVKTTLDKSCTFKTSLPKFFIGGDVKKNLGEVVETVWLTPMPKMTSDHNRIIICKLNYLQDFASHLIMDFYQLSFVYAEYLMMHEYSNGFIIIYDARDANLLEIMSKLNIVEFQQFMAILIEGFGARLRSIHVLTQSKLIDLLINTIKPLLSAKIGNRIHVHYDIKELHSLIDKELLPVDYEGAQRSIEKLKNDWFNVLSSEEHEKYLAEVKACKTDESLRTLDKVNEQVMGLPGSFRALTVD